MIDTLDLATELWAIAQSPSPAEDVIEIMARVIDKELTRPGKRTALTAAELDDLHRRLGGTPRNPTFNDQKVGTK